jgi:hypothetical protein
MRSFLSWLIGPLARLLFGKGGVQADDAPGGWQEPDYSSETPSKAADHETGDAR